VWKASRQRGDFDCELDRENDRRLRATSSTSSTSSTSVLVASRVAYVGSRRMHDAKFARPSLLFYEKLHK
jgi:hypothetical protein